MPTDSRQAILNTVKTYTNVIASFNPRFVYIKCARTGGSSIRNALLSQCDLLDGSDPEYLWQVDDILRADCLMFASVRNPYDRFLSMYYYLKDHHQYPKSESEMEFLDHVQSVWDGRLDHHGIRCHCMRLSDAVCPEGMSDLIRFESIQDDFDRISDSLELKRQLLPHVERSNRPEKTTLDSATKHRVAEMYSIDFLNFGYVK